MKPTDELKDEHRAIKTALAVLERIAQKLDAGEKVETGHLDGLLEFIRVFADTCHHGKEEGLLFPAMEKAGIPRDGGPIGVMLSEHDAGRAFVRGMAQAVDEIKAGGNIDGRKFSENARGYAGLLTRHIDKEDNVLYPMADAKLSAEVQAELEAGFEKLEADVIGEGRHEEFHKLLHRLKKEYLDKG